MKCHTVTGKLWSVETFLIVILNENVRWYKKTQDSPYYDEKMLVQMALIKLCL